MKDVLQGVLIAAAICGAFVFGSRTRAERHLNERTLKPTWFIHGITCLLLALIVLFMPWAWVHARPGEFLAVLGASNGIWGRACGLDLVFLSARCLLEQRWSGSPASCPRASLHGSM